jgi:ribonuclease VapC
MVIDTSAVLAILQDEPERSVFNALIAAVEMRLLSAASLVELSIVLV